ncbi:MAG: SDR family oxidoreductase [Alphaproteobacteria bacterium]|nr:SDR family oxidoreductase [Alphaproteobacteria bacterium]
MEARTTLISGATKGIGRAAAERLSARGHTVIGISRTKPDARFPGQFFQADLGDREARAAVLTEITGRFQVDNLVNNVGVANPQALEDVDPETFARTIDLNLGAAIDLTQAVLPNMRRQKRGRIVNISSRSALGRELRTSYAAAKSGMIGMSRSWALELAGDGITVNVVAPGLTGTDMMRMNNPDIEQRAKAIPMRRLASPDEIAVAIEFFLSDDASYITGQLLHACGGLSIGASSV